MHTKTKTDRGNVNAAMLVVESRVRELMHTKSFRLGEGTIDTINMWIVSKLTTAMERAEQNGRSTVYNYDL